MRFGSTFFNPVNINIYFLVVEAEPTSNGNAFWSWVSIPPNVIFIFLTIDDNAIIVCITLVGARCNGFGGFDELEFDARLGKIVADRKPSLVEKKRGRRFSDDNIANFDHDITSRRNDINSLIRVFRMNVDLGVFFKPSIYIQYRKADMDLPISAN